MKNKHVPVYYESRCYAAEFGESKAWLESHLLNLKVKNDIDRKIAECENSRELDLLIEHLIKEYGVERTIYVLSRTVQHNEWDERFSTVVKERARAYIYHEEVESEEWLCLTCHPCVLDVLFRKLMYHEPHTVVFCDDYDPEDDMEI